MRKAWVRIDRFTIYLHTWSRPRHVRPICPLTPEQSRSEPETEATSSVQIHNSCSKCGQKVNAQNDNFCRKCGQEIVQPPQEPSDLGAAQNAGDLVSIQDETTHGCLGDCATCETLHSCDRESQSFEDDPTSRDEDVDKLIPCYYCESQICSQSSWRCIHLDEIVCTSCLPCHHKHCVSYYSYNNLEEFDDSDDDCDSDTEGIKKDDSTGEKTRI